MSKLYFSAIRSCVLAAAVILAACSPAAAVPAVSAPVVAEAAPVAAIKTIEPGKLIIGMNGDMPMTQLKDGKLSGTDGELMIYVANKLGLEPVIQMMDWAALIEATKQGKIDVMHGAMGWIEPRTKIMNLSDPIYYFGTLLAQKSKNNFSTFADMKGRSVGTVTGFTLIPELKSVEGIGEVKLYDTSDGVLQDLVAGRLDIAILDPPLVQYGIVQHPEWDLKQVAVVPEPDKYPIMSASYNVIFGVTKDEKALEEAISKIIVEDIWPNCVNVKAMTTYGMGAKSWFIPPSPNPRAGIDRPADYAGPKSDDKCF